MTLGINLSAISALAAGTYTNTVAVASSAIPGSSQTITVTLLVSPAAAPSVGAVVNAGSIVPGPVSPGELITIFGLNLGPVTPANLRLTDQGTVPTTLGGTVVTFDGIKAPLIYASATQVNAIVPYEISGRATTTLEVTFNNGTPSLAIQLNVTDTVPGIFTLTETGTGQGAIVNQNNTINGTGVAFSPAPKGSVISIYATGEGQLNPGGVTGSVTPGKPPFPVPLATPVTVTIGGVSAQVTYAGEAPTLISGVIQVNAMVPASVASGTQPLTLTIGSHSSQAGVTVAVQ